MKKKYLYTALLAGCLFSFTACDDYFNPDADNVLVDEDYIGNVNELYSGYIGIAAKVQSVADHAIILSELRSDLLEPTANAPQELWDIYNYKETASNSFATPRGYYDVIVNANNYIQKAIEYKRKNQGAVDDAIFEPLVSGAIRYKVWAYLMLGKLYGEAVYMDEALTEHQDISQFPTLPLDQLITRLLDLMEQGVDGFQMDEEGNMKKINGKQVLVWSEILFQGSGQGDLTWNMINPSPEPLRMELNLWAGKYQEVINIGIPYIYDGGTKRFKLSNEDYNGEWKQFFYSAPVTKTRELINVVPFDYERNQMNRLVSYFSNTYPADYYLKPTEVAMDRFLNQTRKDGITKSDFYRGFHDGGATFRRQNGEWVFYKFNRGLENPSMTQPEVYKNNVHITLYRAADLHLFMAEALNNMGKFPEAEALLNDGIEAYLSKYSGNLRPPFDNELYNSALGTNWGVRGRIDLAPVYPEGITKEFLASGEATEEDSLAYMKALDELLVEETALESAGEARSYFAMIRVAKRWNDPSILAGRVSAKYDAGKQQEVYSRLMDPNNWFVNYDLSDFVPETEE